MIKKNNSIRLFLFLTLLGTSKIYAGGFVGGDTETYTPSAPAQQQQTPAAWSNHSNAIHNMVTTLTAAKNQPSTTQQSTIASAITTLQNILNEVKSN